MLAPNHAMLGVSGVLGLSIVTNTPFFLPLLPLVVFSSLLPDIDHHGSEMSKLIPNVHRFLKHRGASHSLLGWGIVTGGLYLLFQQPYIWITYLILAAGLVGVDWMFEFGMRKSKKLPLAKSILRTIMLIFAGLLIGSAHNPDLRNQILLVLSAGYALHIVGDAVTKDGIPLFFPFSFRFSLKLFKTGSTFESLIGFILFASIPFLLWQFHTLFDIGSWEYWSMYF